jgi:hypothetical protein
MPMPPTDMALQAVVHRNAARVQAKFDDMVGSRKRVQIDNHEFTMMTRRTVSGDDAALGLVLMGRPVGTTEWHPCHQ